MKTRLFRSSMAPPSPSPELKERALEAARAVSLPRRTEAGRIEELLGNHLLWAVLAGSLVVLVLANIATFNAQPLPAEGILVVDQAGSDSADAELAESGLRRSAVMEFLEVRDVLGRRRLLDARVAFEIHEAGLDWVEQP